MAIRNDVPARNVSIDEMFNIATRNNTAWGIEGYQVPKEYLDPLKIIKDREFLKQKKGQKNRNYVTKRGHYLDDLAKVTKVTPGPNKYETLIKWANPKGAARKASTPPPKRSTFIDDIFHEEKLRGVPGAGRYNLIKPLEDVKKDVDLMKQKKIKPSERTCFLNDFQFASNAIPGPGNYNPRLSIQKDKINNVKPAQWITKHKEEEKKRQTSAFPDVGTYKPFPADFETFGRMLIQDKKSNQSQRKAFGSEERFKDPKKTKIVNKSVQPGPGQYALMVNWQGKDEGIKKTTKRQYISFLSNGPNKSIYY